MVWIYILHFLFGGTLGGFCTESSRCSRTCYTQSMYHERCHIFGWSRCTRYRSHSYTCTGLCSRQVCCAGYTGSYCDIDVNECDVGTSGCAHTCFNTVGSFRCSCRTGYTLAVDGKSCDDIDECAVGTSGCPHICYNTVGSYRCSCRAGYTLANSGTSCEDIDECAVRTSGCAHTCSNTVGSYRCSCRAGYTLAVDGASCEVLPGKVSQPCDNQQLGGACKEGCPCNVKENSLTSSSVQGDAGNNMVYIVIGIAMLLVIVLTIVATYCVMKRKRRQNNTANQRSNGPVFSGMDVVPSGVANRSIAITEPPYYGLWKNDRSLGYATEKLQ